MLVGYNPSAYKPTQVLGQSIWQQSTILVIHPPIHKHKTVPEQQLFAKFYTKLTEITLLYDRNMFCLPTKTILTKLYEASAYMLRYLTQLRLFWPYSKF